MCSSYPVWKTFLSVSNEETVDKSVEFVNN